MKRRNLVKLLEAAGFKEVRHGSRHDIYSDGKVIVQVPRHREINEKLAQAIIRQIESDEVEK